MYIYRLGVFLTCFMLLKTVLILALNRIFPSFHPTHFPPHRKQPVCQSAPSSVVKTWRFILELFLIKWYIMWCDHCDHVMLLPDKMHKNCRIELTEVKFEWDKKLLLLLLHIYFYLYSLPSNLTGVGVGMRWRNVFPFLTGNTNQPAGCWEVVIVLMVNILQLLNR